jgi:hypothetical protein
VSIARKKSVYCHIVTVFAIMIIFLNLPSISTFTPPCFSNNNLCHLTTIPPDAAQLPTLQVSLAQTIKMRAVLK